MSNRNHERPENAYRQRGLGLKLSVIGLEVDPGEVLTNAIGVRFKYDRLGSLMLPIIAVEEAGDPLEALLRQTLINPEAYRPKAINKQYDAITNAIAKKVQEQGVVPTAVRAILTRRADNRDRVKRTIFGYGVSSAELSPMVQAARQQLGLPPKFLDVTEPLIAPIAAVHAIPYHTDRVNALVMPHIGSIVVAPRRFVAN